MFDVFHGTAPTYLTDFVVAAVTTIFDHQHVATSWCGGQGHASLTVRSQLLDLPSGTRFQLTSGTFVQTQRSADNLKLTCSLFLTKLQY